MHHLRRKRNIRLHLLLTATARKTNPYQKKKPDGILKDVIKE